MLKILVRSLEDGHRIVPQFNTVLPGHLDIMCQLMIQTWSIWARGTRWGIIDKYILSKYGNARRTRSFNMLI